MFLLYGVAVSLLVDRYDRYVPPLFRELPVCVLLTRSLARHLDFAIGEFRDLKMQPSLERALRHRDIPKA